MSKGNGSSVGESRLVRWAVACGFLGFLGVLLFLWTGFGPWSLAVGIFLGAPLLFLAIVLTLLAALRDLRAQGLL